ncbi:MAG: hypothetical protein SVK08_01620 [Halobacteriota archaeon]|nr:hypothetical protein [Halobacteriota archaeon]
MYKSEVAKSYVGMDSFKDAILSFFTDIGLTIHDNQDASDYRVYKMEGESSQHPPAYIQIMWDTAVADPNYIYFRFWYYWDNSTQTGYGRNYLSQDALLKTASGSSYFTWLYGDQDKIFMRTLVGSDVSYLMMGFADETRLTVETTLTGGATSGSSVALSVSDETGFRIGQTYQIYSLAGEGRDDVTVEAIGSGQITVATLPRDYSSGSIIGELPMKFFISHSNPLSSFSDCLISAPGDASGTENSGSKSTLSNEELYADSSLKVSYDRRGGQKRVLMPWMLFGTYLPAVGYIIRDFLWTDDESLSIEDVLTVGTPEEGIATGGTGTTLSDTSKSWTVDQHIGRYVVIYAGTGYGQTRKITDNDATSITVSGWDVAPDSTSMYRIVDEVYRVFEERIGLSGLYMGIREEL